MNSEGGFQRSTRGPSVLRHASAWGVLTVGFGIAGCESGSFGSNVGDSENAPPAARAQVVNAGATNSFREGSEVLLTGKASEDADGPVLDWKWAQTGGPEVRLIEVNSTTVSFTAPDVSEGTTLTFDLTVSDSTQATGVDTVEIAVLPAQDADRFLTLALRSGESRRDSFTLVPASAGGTGNTEPFVLSVQAFLIYPPFASATGGAVVDCRQAGLPQSSEVPASIGSCNVALLQDLTPTGLGGGGTGITDAWAAGAPTELPTDDFGRIESVWNPRFSFRLPRLDIADFNQQFLPDRRGDMLSPSSVDESIVVLRLELAPENPSAAGGLIGAVAPDDRQNKGVFVSAPNDGSGTPIVDWVTVDQVLSRINLAESNLTAEVYYQAVDPGNKRLTLNDWLCNASFAEAEGCEELEEEETRIVTLREVARAGGSTESEEFAHAVYLNNYDLGLGRDMFTRTDVDTGNVYSFVRNHVSLEGALRASEPIVTVVMEFSPPEDQDGNPVPGAARFTKFFTYTPDGSGDSVRVNTMNFDGRGELLTPGNCVACHGGTDPAGGVGTQGGVTLNANTVDGAGRPCEASSLDPVCFTYPEGGNLSATFLPWDVDSLLFVDTDPAILNSPLPFDGETLQSELETAAVSSGLSGGVRKEQQLGQLRRLNEAALATYVQDSERTASGVALLEHWYESLDSSVFPPVINGDYCDSPDCGAEAPDGWPDDESSSAQLYFDVYARNCRMCHTNIVDQVLQFDEYPQFLDALGCGTMGSPQSCGRGVFTRGVMPAARLTMDRLWTNFETGGTAAGELLAVHLEAAGLVEGVPTAPAPLANITTLPTVINVNDVTTIVPRHATVRLSGATSDFANTFEWSRGSGFPMPGPELIGVNREELAFAPAEPGDYPVTLTINGNVAASTLIRVENFVPVAVNDEQNAEPNGPSILIDFLNNDVFQREACAPACPEQTLLAESPDLPFSIALSFIAQETPDDDDGTFELVEGEPCTREQPEGCTDDRLRYTPAPVDETHSDTFTYTITDADGDVSSSGLVTVSALQTLAGSSAPSGAVTSDVEATLNLIVTGGEQAAPGADRYSVTVLNGPSRGELGGLDATNNGSDSYTYTTFPFETGQDSFTLLVTDSANNTTEVPVEFVVDPQVRFASSANGNLAVTTIVRDATCSGSSCHTPATSPPNRPWFATDLSDSDAWAEVRRAVTVVNGSVDVENSKILCVPQARCAPTTDSGSPGHDGHIGQPGAELLDAEEEDDLRRWLQEGAQLN